MRRWKGYTAESLDNKPSSKIMRQMHAQAATEYILNMEDVELPASFDPPTDTRFKFWACGKSEHLARTEAEGGIGACHRVTVSKKQNIQSEIPVHLNLEYTMIMTLPYGRKLKLSFVFVEEDKQELRGHGEVLEVEPEAVILPLLIQWRANHSLHPTCVFSALLYRLPLSVAVVVSEIGLQDPARASELAAVERRTR